MRAADPRRPVGHSGQSAKCRLIRRPKSSTMMVKITAKILALKMQSADPRLSFLYA